MSGSKKKNKVIKTTKTETVISTIIAASAAILILVGAGFLSMATPLVFAQQEQSGGSVQGSVQSQIAYKTAYPKLSADSKSSVTVQSEHHLYKPGETVKITGSVSNEIRQQAKSDTVTVKLIDVQGNVAANQQATVDSNGEYTATLNLPPTASEGRYTAASKLEVQASVLGLLDAQLQAKLEASPSPFIVAKESTIDVNVQANGSGDSSATSSGQKFTVKIASNSTVDAVALKQDQKMLVFTVEGQSGTAGVTQVTIPKAMLSGQMAVMVDGKAMASDSNDVIVTSDTNTETTFEINYHHSKHDVAVSGTSVVPEFPLSEAIVMAGAIGSVIATVAVMRNHTRGLGIK